MVWVGWLQGVWQPRFWSHSTRGLGWLWEVPEPMSLTRKGGVLARWPSKGSSSADILRVLKWKFGVELRLTKSLSPHRAHHPGPQAVSEVHPFPPVGTKTRVQVCL